MRTLYVMDPLEKINVAGDSTYVLMLEGVRRGHPVAMCTPDQLSVRNNVPWAEATEVHVTADAPFFHTGEARPEPLSAFDCIWMRKDPPFDMDYVFSTYLLDLADTLVLNDPRSIKLAQEKLYALQWPHLCPPTMFTNSLADVKAFAAEHGRVVLKPWDGNGGRGIVVTEHGDRNLGALVELLTDEGRAYCIAQRYLPEIASEGDKRILLIDGEPRGWFLRVPGEEDHRGNMHVGASVRSFELTARDRQICQELSGRLKAEGLVFVGIDVIGEHLTEINVTSPTGLREVLALQGVDLGAELVDAAERRR